MMVEHNLKLQEEYDKYVNVATKESILTRRFDFFGDDTMYLSSGQSSYFNNYIDENGLRNIRINEYDCETLKQLNIICNYPYGKPKNFGKKCSLIYLCPAGSLEVDYARQSFPSGILESIFGWEARNKEVFPTENFCGVDIVVGEEEYDYWMRVVERKIEYIKVRGSLSIDNKVWTEDDYNIFRQRVYELLKIFCIGYNRIYFINILDILNNRVGGFLENLRYGNVTDEEYLNTINRLDTFKMMIEKIVGGSISIEEKAKTYIRNEKNSHSQWGLATIDGIDAPVSYVKVRTKYSLLQEYLKSIGYNIGDSIDYYKLNELFLEEAQPIDKRSNPR